MNAPSPVRIVYARLQASEPWMQAAPRVERALAQWPQGRCMGVFMGLFGLTNHELLVLLSIQGEAALRADKGAALATAPTGGSAVGTSALASLQVCLPDDVRVLEVLPLKATVRPATDAPFTRAGIHVFRFFTLPFDRMDEAVAFSSAGWETFERNDESNADEGYRTEPLGLFAQDGPGWHRMAPLAGVDNATHGQLLLVTWYDSMTSWERSRTPNPQATLNFRKRAALTSSIVAYATRVANTA